MKILSHKKVKGCAHGAALSQLQSVEQGCGAPNLVLRILPARRTLWMMRICSEGTFSSCLTLIPRASDEGYTSVTFGTAVPQNRPRVEAGALYKPGGADNPKGPAKG